MPLLFSVCGRAQGVAAAMAAEAALGIEVAGSLHAARAHLVFGEAIQEHLWRVLLDWPRQVGIQPRVQLMTELCAGIGQMAKPLIATGGWKTIGGRLDADYDDARQSFSRVLKNVLHREIFGCDPAQWLELGTQQELEAWYENTDTLAAQILRSLAQCARFGASKVAAMPSPNNIWLQEIAEAMHEDPAFSHQPNWRGAALETGALARQRQHPLLRALTATEGNSVFARALARLIELMHLADAMRTATGNACAGWIGSQPLRKGVGIAWVETARGLLTHRIASDGGRILDYRTIAPTEWNFHADGALVQGLRGMAAASEAAARSKAEWMVQSLDPCVAYEITVQHA
ncbi:nickel-dependent hydrogenase large subunit [Candidatus Ferrigenium straubiae]|uniref:nickel-dependent hydrogenase large subunit n=1 Tax=Candidatus Ferrigenium straubiae TaxID=2919506 RepID=UPI003F4AEE81